MLEIEQACHFTPWSEATLRDCFRQNYLIYGALTEHDELLGYCIVQVIANEFNLMNIAVCPSHQGQGIGAQLLARLLESAAAVTAQIWLEVRVSNAQAIRLYEGFGFKVIGKRPHYYRCATGYEDALVMGWHGEHATT
ncbi:ribosomal protein S18-alanine N-acetyltransferase [Pseudidiomarina salilacus]|uniref:ribosomal protein S18-alanine N-acetyltransferase n=1 Tax=Pseudidiomarina salilacus TaxID=3384452 RepID=UPI003984E917